MSNELQPKSDTPNELQNAETEKPRLQRLAESYVFNVAVKISEGVAAMIAIIAAILAVINSPTYALIPFNLISNISAIVFVILGLIFYFFILRPQNKRLESVNKSLQNEVVNKRRNELMIPKEDYDKEINALTEQKAEYQRQVSIMKTENAEQGNQILALNNEKRNLIEEREKTFATLGNLEQNLADNWWIINQTKRHAEDIVEYVKVLKPVQKKYNLDGIKPSIEFTFEIANDSHFDVSFEIDQSTYIVATSNACKSEQLQEKKSVFPTNIKAHKTQTVILTQRLNDADIVFIKNFINASAAKFEFYDLRIDLALNPDVEHQVTDRQYLEIKPNWVDAKESEDEQQTN